MAKRKKRFIVPRHQDYWEQVHGTDEGLPCNLEFCVYADEASAKKMYGKNFYHFDIGNIAAAEALLDVSDDNEEVWLFEDSKERFREQTERLKAGEIDYFIDHLFFHNEHEGEWYMRPLCREKTLFDCRSKRNYRSYYAVIYIREEKRLTPEVLCAQLEKFSPVWFGDQCCYLFLNGKKRI